MKLEIATLLTLMLTKTTVAVAEPLAKSTLTHGLTRYRPSSGTRKLPVTGLKYGAGARPSGTWLNTTAVGEGPMLAGAPAPYPTVKA